MRVSRICLGERLRKKMSTPGLEAQIVTYVSSVVVAGGGGAVIAWFIFQTMGVKWIESKFAEGLEAYKHARLKEIEQLRFEIAALMDRTVKLHQMEFEVLPEAWALLTDAYAILRPVSLGVVVAPDLNQLSAEQLEFFIEKVPLEDFQKNELRVASDKLKYYSDAIQRHDLNRALDACGAFHIYLTKNGIFIPPEIKKKFSDFDVLLAEVIGERKISLRRPNTMERFDKGVALDSNGPALLKSLESDVQGRLWNSIKSDVAKQ
jgi:hypothetical protein